MTVKNYHLLTKTSLKIWMPRIIFEETLVSSFLPEGYLEEKMSGKNVKKVAKEELKNKKNNDFYKLQYFSVLQLYNTAKEYIEKNKTLDYAYFAKVINCVKSFVSKIKG